MTSRKDQQIKEELRKELDDLIFRKAKVTATRNMRDKFTQTLFSENEHKHHSKDPVERLKIRNDVPDGRSDRSRDRKRRESPIKRTFHEKGGERKEKYQTKHSPDRKNKCSHHDTGDTDGFEKQVTNEHTISSISSLVAIASPLSDRIMAPQTNAIPTTESNRPYSPSLSLNSFFINDKISPISGRLGISGDDRIPVSVV